MSYLEAVTLTGQHIRLEPLQPLLHAPSMFQCFEPRVMDFLGRGDAGVSSESDLVAHLQLLNERPHRINWAVRILDSGAIAGRISYSEVKEADKWVEIGTMLMPAFWGGSANPESKLLLMTRAFEVLGVNRVQFKVDSRNERSQAAMAKLGAVREGVLRDYQIRSDGFVRSSVVCSVLRNEWQTVKASLETRVHEVR